MIFVEVPLRRIEYEIEVLGQSLSDAPDAPSAAYLRGAMEALLWLLHAAKAPSLGGVEDVTGRVS